MSLLPTLALACISASNVEPAAEPVSADSISYDAPWETEPAAAVQTTGTGWEKYDFYQGGDRFVRYTTPNGVNAALHISSCSFNTWCCTGGHEICYYNYSSTSSDDILMLSLAGAESIACALLHREDDVPRQLYYATDSGNGYPGVATGWVFVLKERGGHTDAPVHIWGEYSIICF